MLNPLLYLSVVSMLAVWICCLLQYGLQPVFNIIWIAALALLISAMADKKRTSVEDEETAVTGEKLSQVEAKA